MSEHLSFAGAHAAEPALLEDARPTRVDRATAARAGWALMRANLRYWPGVAPEVHRQLARWRRRAEEIGDPALRSLALDKLAEEGFNAEVAATLATLVARRRRRQVIEALVALEVLFDFLDGLTEVPATAAGSDGACPSQALTDAVTPAEAPCGDYYACHPQGQDGGYLEELAGAVRTVLATLPAAARLADHLRAAAGRSAEAQLRIHAASAAGPDGLERWARAQARESPQRWRELLAGAASSVLCLHALIAAAADPRTTAEHGRQIDQAYLWISALPTILDSVVDRDADAGSGRAGYLALYESSDVLAARLSEVAHTALRHTRGAPHAAHHVMTLVGVVAYYGSAPTASSPFARSATGPMMRQLRPLIGPTLAVMRAWRLGKRVAIQRRRAAGSAGASA
jgi:tetraprenyl-beta-curcumene synthase